MNVPTIGRKADPSVAQIERRLRDALDQQAAVQAELDQAEADEHGLDAAAVDAYLGTLAPDDYERRQADVQRRLVAYRRELEHLTAIVAGLRGRGIVAVNAEITAREAKAIREREKIDRERGALEAQLARLDATAQKVQRRLATIADERLPALALFDPEATAELAEREHSREREAAQLAHRILSGEQVDVPAELDELVAQAAPGVRADRDARKQAERASLRRLYAPLNEYEQSDGPVRRGFED